MNLKILLTVALATSLASLPLFAEEGGRGRYLPQDASPAHLNLKGKMKNNMAADFSTDFPDFNGLHGEYGYFLSNFTVTP